MKDGLREKFKKLIFEEYNFVDIKIIKVELIRTTENHNDYWVKFKHNEDVLSVTIKIKIGE